MRHRGQAYNAGDQQRQEIFGELRHGFIIQVSDATGLHVMDKCEDCKSWRQLQMYISLMPMVKILVATKACYKTKYIHSERIRWGIDIAIIP